MAWRVGRAALVLIGTSLSLAACQREDRNLGPQPPETPAQAVAVSGLAPGGLPPAPAADPRGKLYEANATHLSNGQRLYQQFNCAGCHFNGGGGIGPALMDAQWRYGGSIDNIVASILQGRPNGMPSFQGKIPEDQVWEIAAYVRSLSGQGDRLAEPSRADAMSSTPPINHIKNPPPQGDASATVVGPS